jgi:uncharacterized membrane protein YeaQ/YmgE (transglycosylase-associated protein family)
VSIIGWLLLGLVAGALARLLVPGRDPMGWVGTLLLGLAGSFVGGWLADVLFDDESIGLVGAVIGAVIVLVIYNALTHNKRGYARS